MLHNRKTYIRLMEESDVQHKVDWFNDEDVRKTLNVDFPISAIGTKKWLHSVSANNTRCDFIICSKEDNMPIGYVGLVNIDYKNSKAESYLGVGNKKYWGKGHASEARRLILDYAFEHLALNKVYSYVWVENEKMKHINQKVGFQIEGTLRNDICYNGVFRDKHIMGVLRKEYKK
ncbi:GNAT family N-acetyltransferase [Oceanobacillus locisalsi]|uniref:GNAT family N-acetyltransferase n=1 Tax=Oceanobacillus locisalsi TaxID=546107 RepID=A0ABW3NDH2_9BACI